MNQSTNYNFNLPEGTDLVNLLTQLIPNWGSLDTILKGVENQAFTNCTEATSLGVHAISRTNADGKILKWIASANFTAGDTFTVDGNVVAASTPSGATLATGAYITGAVIIAALNSDESAMTVFVTGSNVAADSERLGGNLPSYYAKDSDIETAKQDIIDLDNLMGTTSISAIGDGTVTGAISAINNALPRRTVLTVTANGSKSVKVLLNELYALITDKTKIDSNSYIALVISGTESRFFISAISSSAVIGFRSVISSDGFSTDIFTLDASDSTWLRSTGGTNRTDISSTVLSSGATISININAN